VPLFSCYGCAQLIHRTAETDQDRIVNLRFSGRRGHSLCLSFATRGGFAVKPYNLDSTSMQFRLNLQGRGILGAFMRESSTRTLKPKKLQTATMKRRALKLKSIEVLPTKARSPRVRALVVSALQPSGM
jgi:hypothetical protein